MFYNQAVYPGKMLAPVQLTGPANGSTLATTGTVFSCETVENAVGYQLLFGSDPDRVMDFSVISDTTNTPSQLISTLPATNTWWTVRAYDQFGSTIYADPRLIKRPPNRPPVAQTGPDQVCLCRAGRNGNGYAQRRPTPQTLTVMRSLIPGPGWWRPYLPHQWLEPDDQPACRCVTPFN